VFRVLRLCGAIVACFPVSIATRDGDDDDDDDGRRWRPAASAATGDASPALEFRFFSVIYKCFCPLSFGMCVGVGVCVVCYFQGQRDRALFCCSRPIPLLSPGAAVAFLGRAAATTKAKTDQTAASESDERATRKGASFVLLLSKSLQISSYRVTHECSHAHTTKSHIPRPPNTLLNTLPPPPPLPPLPPFPPACAAPAAPPCPTK
jgi:hypothetical protein